MRRGGLLIYEEDNLMPDTTPTTQDDCPRRAEWERERLLAIARDAMQRGLAREAVLEVCRETLNDPDGRAMLVQVTEALDERIATVA
jgi:hypothetical protein